MDKIDQLGMEPMVKNDEDQIRMEASIKLDIQQMYETQGEYVNGMMKPEFVKCSFKEKTLTMAFPILEWEMNRVGVLHGGITASTFDYAMGLIARFFAGQSFAPTIQLETVFIRPISLGEVFEITVKTNFSGRKLTYLYGEGYIKSSGKLAATATSSYLNMNTTQQDEV